MTQETAMLHEAAEAPDVVAHQLARNETLCRALGERLRSDPPRFVATCARGSSDNAATFAKYVIEIQLGSVVASLGPSIRSIYGTRPRLAGALFLAVSQSGQSPDLISLAEVARDDGALTVAVVNDPSSPLAARCEIVLPLHAGAELSVAATKSLIASLAAILQLTAHWSADPALLDVVRRLPQDLAAAARSDWSAAEALLAVSEDLYVVGRGPGFAAAQEAALKLKEIAGIHAEAYSAAELMHGPLALAGPSFPALVFSQNDAALPGVVELVERLAALGVPQLVAGPASRSISSNSSTPALPMAEDLHPFAAPIAAMQSFYPLAERVARARGRDPERPPHLIKVTETL
jgi:glucosamine--fructose-6-phosphate aminotransferase (isomerizing)